MMLSSNADTNAGMPLNPLLARSKLHHIQPLGLGTGDVESLTSYFCRLSNSHSCSTHDLAAFVMRTSQTQRWPQYLEATPRPRFVWHERAISGICDAAQTWSAALSELTGVERLDRLTLLPLQGLIVAKSLMAQQARWCPDCLAQDLADGQPAYFRLSWDIGVNKVCHHHHTPLVAHCPVCERTRVRHSSHCVVPGWCCHCGSFLGTATAKPQHELAELSATSCTATDEPGEMNFLLKRAIELAELLARTSACVPADREFEPSLEQMHESLEFLIEKLDFGIAARFAKRVGIGKPCLHGWRKNRSAITLEGALQVSSFTGLDLASFFEGQTQSWVKPDVQEQLSLELQHPPRLPGPCPRVHDWPDIRQKLKGYLRDIEPLSVTQIGLELDIDDRLLYLHANDLARQLAQRHLTYRERRFKVEIACATEKVKQACEMLNSQGVGISPAALETLVPRQTMNVIPNLYTVLTEFAQSRSDGYQTQ